MINAQVSDETSLPFTSAARNALWIYPAPSTPRFAGAPTIIETKRSYNQPDFDKLPEEADVTVELYGNAQAFRLDAITRRIYIERFEFVSFRTDADASAAFAALWERVKHLNTLDEIQTAPRCWFEENSTAR